MNELIPVSGFPQKAISPLEDDSLNVMRPELLCTLLPQLTPLPGHMDYMTPLASEEGL